MNNTDLKGCHLFYIPVMGTGFSIDTPLKVAKFGISSVISLVDDVLIEQMRKFHCLKNNLEYSEIGSNSDDARANRITAYLELLNLLVRNQINELQSSSFDPRSDITLYFEMLPDSPLKQFYIQMLLETDPKLKLNMQNILRSKIVAGSIDVNIMTKVDRENYKRGNKLPVEFSDGMSALRGYARSSLQSSIIFSAGISTRLFSYLERFNDFYPDEEGILRKKIVLKVSDFRSALVQGKFLAKKGLWVSEYRIESSLNCGGHAFVNDGFLLGLILEEFGSKKKELIEQLHDIFNLALVRSGRNPILSPPKVRITVQGGIGTSDENKFLLEHYGVDSTGWGTPFLLVPEVTNVDEVHLKKLSSAGIDDVFLSDRSPLGIPFWSLKNSMSEESHQQRIDLNKPGSPCPKGYAASNTEFTKVPICHASRTYQKRKLQQIEGNGIPLSKQAYLKNIVMSKSCICHDLAGGATLKNGIDNNAQTAVCCGPNIVNFSKIASLEEMVGHIYGRLSLITASDRPHMFIKELSLYVDHFRDEFHKASEGLIDKTTKRFEDLKQNLINSIEYYQNLAEQFGLEQKEKFLSDLDTLFAEIEEIFPAPITAKPLVIVT